MSRYHNRHLIRILKALIYQLSLQNGPYNTLSRKHDKWYAGKHTWNRTLLINHSWRKSKLRKFHSDIDSINYLAPPTHNHCMTLKRIKSQPTPDSVLSETEKGHSASLCNRMRLLHVLGREPSCPCCWASRKIQCQAPYTMEMFESASQYTNDYKFSVWGCNDIVHCWCATDLELDRIIFSRWPLRTVVWHSEL